MIRFFNPGLGYQKLKDEIDPEIQRVLSEGQLILRKDVETFEQNVADYVGSKHCIALNSCTDALYLALRGLGIGPEDEVLVPSRTFVATAQVVVQVGATPVYIDTDGTYAINDRTRAIIPVHIEGDFWGDMEELVKVADYNGIHVIEDAAQAFGAIQNNKRAGSFGIAGCFSFYPAKTLGAYGDAGALVTDDDELAKWVRGARNHFKEDASDWGVNSRLDNLQAAILNVKFRHYERALARRQQIANRYLAELKGCTLPPNTFGRIWQDFIIRTDKRDELYDYLKEKGIETMKNNYPFPVPKLPGAQQYEDETLRLPCNELLRDEEVSEVIRRVNEFYTK